MNLVLIVLAARVPGAGAGVSVSPFIPALGMYGVVKRYRLGLLAFVWCCLFSAVYLIVFVTITLYTTIPLAICTCDGNCTGRFAGRTYSNKEFCDDTETNLRLMHCLIGVAALHAILHGASGSAGKRLHDNVLFTIEVPTTPLGSAVTDGSITIVTVQPMLASDSGDPATAQAGEQRAD